MLDPHPTGRPEIRSARPPGDFERAVAAATERIGAGEMSKVVLAREVVASAAAAHDPAAIFGALREQFPSCFCFCCGTPEAAFLGASPELLVRRSGASASTVALAGSTRRSSDPAVDDHLGEQLLRSDKDRREQRIVGERIVRTLRPHAVWVEAAAEPEVVKVANIQHLATPVIAQLAEPRSAVELAGLLHPTPAVGGEPWPAAATAIAELEQMDRGWYAGPVGWMDATEDGEFCVALRSALLRDRDAHLYAGVGVVAGSDPAAELAETEVKLSALLPLLAVRRLERPEDSSAEQQRGGSGEESSDCSIERSASSPHCLESWWWSAALSWRFVLVSPDKGGGPAGTEWSPYSYSRRSGHTGDGLRRRRRQGRLYNGGRKPHDGLGVHGPGGGDSNR